MGARPLRLVPMSPPAVAPAGAPAWGLAELRGRLVELSGAEKAAHLTAAVGLVLEAQLQGDRAVWVTLEQSAFFPPDLADSGIDLDALPVVRVPEVALAGRAADHLVRSGGFGLVVVDLSSGPPAERGARAGAAALPTPLLTRLLGLAHQHGITVLLLTRKSPGVSSLHSLISLRAEATWRRRDGRYEVSIDILKDKRKGPGWHYVEVCRGPAGLR
jgi:recombination protein RecA